MEVSGGGGGWTKELQAVFTGYGGVNPQFRLINTPPPLPIKTPSAPQKLHLLAPGVQTTIDLGCDVCCWLWFIVVVVVVVCEAAVAGWSCLLLVVRLLLVVVGGLLLLFVIAC